MHLFYSTFKNASEIESTALTLLNNDLIKCCNIINSESISIYKWNDKIEKNAEALALFKVSIEKKALFIEELEKIHPYDTPCIIEISLSSVSGKFQSWINKEG